MAAKGKEESEIERLHAPERERERDESATDREYLPFSALQEAAALIQRTGIQAQAPPQVETHVSPHLKGLMSVRVDGRMDGWMSAGECSPEPHAWGQGGVLDNRMPMCLPLRSEPDLSSVCSCANPVSKATELISNLATFSSNRYSERAILFESKLCLVCCTSSCSNGGDSMAVPSF